MPSDDGAVEIGSSCAAPNFFCEGTREARVVMLAFGSAWVKIMGAAKLQGYS